MPVEMRAGHSVSWRVAGEGPRLALAVHCSLAHSGAWSGITERLADRLRLITFDLPGHGRSGDLQADKTLYDASLRISASFVEEPIDLIGHSFGGLVAMGLAMAVPDAIRTLTLIEPVLFPAARGLSGAEDHQAARALWLAALREGRLEEAARLFTDGWGSGQDWDHLDPRRRDYIIHRMHMVPAGEKASEDDCGRLLRPGGLESLDMPVMIIRGTDSPPIVASIAEALAARMPDVGVAVVPGAGHMLPITHPDQVAGLIGVNLDRG